MRISSRVIAALGLTLAAASSVAGDLGVKNDQIDDVTVRFRSDCDSAPQTLNLGDMRMQLADFDAAAYEIRLPGSTPGDSSMLHASFEVDRAISGPGSGGTGIWEWMDLHWLNLIWHDDCPATYNGNAPNLPIIDTPNGGWDYQQPIGDDALPWYWNAGEEAGRHDSNLDGTIDGNDARVTEECDAYNLFDLPTDCPANGFVGFSSYVFATARDGCDLPDCLDENEMLLLAGFDWTVSSTDIQISDTFTAPSPFDVQMVQTALGNAGFNGWTVVDDKVICCPSPKSLSLLVLGSLLITSRRRSG